MIGTPPASTLTDATVGFPGTPTLNHWSGPPERGSDYGVRVRMRDVAKGAAPVIGALLLAVALSGCGGDADPVAADSTTPAPSGPADPTEPSETVSVAVSPSVRPLDLSGRDLAGFTAQDGAIACLFDRMTGVPAVRCDVPENGWVPPAKPRRCRLDWGQAVGLTADGSAGRFLCVGDTVVGITGATDGGNELAPGTLASYDTLACLVQPDGVSCYDTASGQHSIFVTPFTYEVI